MTIDTIKELSNRELVSLYKLMVQVDHYDPMETPETVVLVHEASIDIDELEAMILERMEKV